MNSQGNKKVISGKLVSQANQYFDATRKSFITTNFKSNFRNLEISSYLLVSTLGAVILVSIYLLLLNYVTLPGINTQNFKLTRNPNFIVYFINNFLTGGALGKGSILALGLIPILPFVIQSRALVKNRGYLPLRAYLLPFISSLVGSIILIRSYQIWGIELESSYAFILALCILGGLILLNLDSALYSILRIGLFELNASIIFITTIYNAFSLSLPNGIYYWTLGVVIGIPIFLFIGRELSFKVQLVNMSRGSRRAIPSTIQFPLLEPKLLMGLTVVYMMGLVMTTIFSNAFTDDTNLNEWNLVNVTVSSILLGLMILIFYGKRHYFYASNARKLSELLDSRKLLLIPKKSDSQPFNQPLVPGMQTEDYLVNVESQRLKFSLLAFIGILLVWLLFGIYSQYVGENIRSVVFPVTYSFANILFLKVVYRVRNFFEQKNDLEGLINPLYSRSLWDTLRIMINDLEGQGFDIEEARELLSKASEVGYLRKLVLARKLAKLVDSPFLSTEVAKNASFSVRMRVLAIDILGFLFPLVIICAIIILFMRLIGYSPDTSNTFGLIISIGITAALELYNWFKRQSEKSELTSKSDLERALMHINKAFSLFQGMNPNYAKAAMEYKKGFKMLEEQKEEVPVSALVNYARCLYMAPNPNRIKAEEKLIQALSLVKEENNLKNLIIVTLELGNFFCGSTNSNDKEKGIQYYHEAFELCKKEGFSDLQASVFDMLKTEYEQSGGRNSELVALYAEMHAEIKSKKSKAYFDFIKQWIKYLFKVDERDYEKIKELCLEALEFIDVEKDPSEKVYFLYYYTYCLTAQDEPDWKEALEAAKENFNYTVTFKVSKSIALVNQLLGLSIRNQTNGSDIEARDYHRKAIEFAIGQGDLSQILDLMNDYEILYCSESNRFDSIIIQMWKESALKFDNIYFSSQLTLALDLEKDYLESDKWVEKAIQLQTRLKGKAKYNWITTYSLLRENKLDEILEQSEVFESESRYNLIKTLVVYVKNNDFPSEPIKDQKDLVWFKKVVDTYFDRYFPDKKQKFVTFINS